jgi:hypothetical protein
MSIYKDIRWRTKAKFLEEAQRLAGKKYTTEAAVKAFENVTHDFKQTRHDAEFNSIYSRKTDCYQFDTLIQAELDPYLIFINVNSRKAFAYRMKDKSAAEVHKALQNHLNVVGKINELTSDEDPSYLSHEVQEWMSENKINHYTTEEHNHHILGILNRFIKTLRDLNQDRRDVSVKDMPKLLEMYNNSKHSAIGKAPNEFTLDDEVQYIQDKFEQQFLRKQERSNGIALGDVVRVASEHKFGKKRMNYGREGYTVQSVDGNSVLIKGKDNAVARYPAYKLKVDPKAKIAKTANDDKYGVVDKILSYDEDKNKYTILYEGSSKKYQEPPENLRKGNPSRLSLAEVVFWNKQGGMSVLPDRFKRLLSQKV